MWVLGPELRSSARAVLTELLSHLSRPESVFVLTAQELVVLLGEKLVQTALLR